MTRRSLPVLLALACLALVLGGCRSLAPQPALDLPFAVPSTWSNADSGAPASATALAQWWLRFDDPLLSSLVAQAMLANTSFNSAQAALRQARWGLWGRLAHAARSERNEGNHDR